MTTITNEVAIVETEGEIVAISMPTSLPKDWSVTGFQEENSRCIELSAYEYRQLGRAIAKIEHEGWQVITKSGNDTPDIDGNGTEWSVIQSADGKRRRVGFTENGNGIVQRWAIHHWETYFTGGTSYNVKKFADGKFGIMIWNTTHAERTAIVACTAGATLKFHKELEKWYVWLPGQNVLPAHLQFVINPQYTQYNFILDYLLDGYISVERNGSITEAEAEFAMLDGYQRETWEIMGNDWRSFPLNRK